MKPIEYKKISVKFYKIIENNQGGTLLLVAMSFLPIMILIALMGIQFSNNSTAFRQNSLDTQIYYVAEMGIERYKNELIANPSYNEVLNFQKTIGDKTYDVEVTASHESDPERVRIISTVLGTNISTQRVITLSRITP